MCNELLDYVVFLKFFNKLVINDIVISDKLDLKI